MPNNYKSLRDHVRSYVADKIQKGEIVSGDKLSEIDVSKELGISRTPTREALLQLESEGLLEYVPRRGFTVKLFTEKQKNDTFTVIGALDALAAKLSIPNVTDEVIAKMNECVDKMDIAIKYKDYPSYCSLQEEFHNCYRQLCNNDVIIKVLSDFQEGFIPNTYIGNDKERLFEVSKEMNDEHRKIVKLLQNKEEKKIYAFLLEEHWATKYDDLI